jgi:hypothetical protein
MKKNRCLPLLVPIVAGGLMEILYFWPSMIYVVMALEIILFLFTVRQFLRSGVKQEKWWNLLILPAVFSSSVIVFSIIVPKFFAHPLFFVNVLFLYLYFRSVYRHLHSSSPAPDSYDSLRNLSAYGNFLAVYFVASSVYGFQAFLNARVWSLMLPLLVIFCLIVYQVFWSDKINSREGLFFILLAGFVLVELGWSISFLPLDYYILGLISAVFYYMMIGLTRFYLLGVLNKRTIKKYLILGFLSLTVVILSARWL